MPAVTIDTQFPWNRKIASLTDAAFRLQITAICFCGTERNDGFLSMTDVKDIGGTKELVRELVNSSVWERTGEGFVVHDYLIYNVSREDDERRRAELSQKRAEAGRLGGIRSGQARAIQANEANTSDGSPVPAKQTKQTPSRTREGQDQQPFARTPHAQGAKVVDIYRGPSTTPHPELSPLVLQADVVSVMNTLELERDRTDDVFSVITDVVTYYADVSPQAVAQDYMSWQQRNIEAQRSGHEYGAIHTDRVAGWKRQMSRRRSEGPKPQFKRVQTAPTTADELPSLNGHGESGNPTWDELRRWFIYLNDTRQMPCRQGVCDSFDQIKLIDASEDTLTVRLDPSMHPYHQQLWPTMIALIARERMKRPKPLTVILEKEPHGPGTNTTPRPHSA